MYVHSRPIGQNVLPFVFVKRKTTHLPNVDFSHARNALIMNAFMIRNQTLRVTAKACCNTPPAPHSLTALIGFRVMAACFLCICIRVPVDLAYFLHKNCILGCYSFLCRLFFFTQESRSMPFPSRGTVAPVVCTHQSVFNHLPATTEALGPRPAGTGCGGRCK